MASPAEGARHNMSNASSGSALLVRHKIWGEVCTSWSSDSGSCSSNRSHSDRDVLRECMGEDIPPAIRQHSGVMEDDGYKGRSAPLRSGRKKHHTVAPSGSCRDSLGLLQELAKHPDALQISSDSYSSSRSVHADDGGRANDDGQPREAGGESGVGEQAPDLSNIDPGLSSIGARDHATGKCKPCSWIWKTNGCVHGRACVFCHSCPEGENARRRRERNYMLSLQRKMGIQPEPPANGKGKRKGKGTGNSSTRVSL